MITPQTNVTLEEIAQRLLKCSRICVCGHVNPDGDCIGSTLGLTWALKSIGKEVTPLIADSYTIDKSLEFLPCSSDAVSADYLVESNIQPFDAFICVDVPSDKRIGESATTIKNKASLTITIDHHAVNNRCSDLCYTDPDITSTTLIVWQLCKHLGIDEHTPNVSELATCIFAGLLTDSGCFINQNVDATAFYYAKELVIFGANPSYIASKIYQSRNIASLKLDAVVVDNMEIFKSNNNLTCAISYITKSIMDSLEAVDADAENSISLLRSIDGVDIACILKERKGQIRGSLRSKDNTDVSAIANEFGGGGHKAAAGFTLNTSMTEAIDVIKNRLSEL